MSIAVLTFINIFDNDNSIKTTLQSPTISIMLLFFVSILLAYISIITLCIEYKNDGTNESTYLKELKNLRKEQDGDEIDKKIGEITLSQYYTGKTLDWRNEPIVYGVTSIVIFLISTMLLILATINQISTGPTVKKFNILLVTSISYFLPIALGYLISKLTKYPIVLWKNGKYVLIIFWYLLTLTFYYFLKLKILNIYIICFISGVILICSFIVTDILKYKKTDTCH